jgi:hypothetical protein
VSTLAGLPLEHVEIAMSTYGSWRADAVMTSGEAPTGPAVLIVGDLELHGTVFAGGLDGPGQPHAVVVGGPGWANELARPLSYRSDAGVRLATVLRDLSIAAAEPIEQPADGPIGPHFAVPASSSRGRVRLSDVLGTLHRRGYVALWRVDPDGTTRFGARAPSEATGRAVEVERNAAVGMRRLGVDNPASFLPGATFEGEPIRRLVVRERNDAREALIWQ